MNRFSKISFSGWAVPFFLALLCFLSFGVLIPTLGFYWDDWAKILVYRLQGLDYYWPYYAGDRPLSAWTHVLLTPILGVKPVAWQVFTLGLRFFSAWGLFKLLVLLNSRKKMSAAIAAGIFTVYPLFSQQAIAVTFHQQWLQFALVIWSFVCMVQAIHSRKNKWGWIGLSLLFSILQLSITEYFAPLELLRPFILWFAVQKPAETKKHIHLTFKAWLPYLGLIAAFFVWRIFLMPLPAGDPYRANTLYQIFEKPLETLIWLGKTLAVDLSYIFLGSWADAFQTRLANPLSLSYLAALGLSILAGGLAIFFLTKIISSEENGKQDNSWVGMAVTIGIAGVLLGPIPAWITGRQVLYNFHSDRYALPALLGLSMLSAGLIEWLGKSRLQKAVLAGIIIFLGCGYQIRTAIDYRNNWTQQMRLYWQLTWRAPQLENPTAIYSENELVPDQGLFSMSAALNQLYPQDSNPDLMDFWFYTLRPKFNAGAPKNLNLSNDSTFRTLHYIGNSPNTLLVNLDPAHGNCLWVLRPEDEFNPYLSDLTRAMLPISNLERIKNSPLQGYPPQDLFGQEPRLDWCYSFQKAELAWQEENWPDIVRLGNEFFNDGEFQIKEASNSPREWWPFIVGYAKSGDVRRAIEISRQSLQQDERYHAAICNLWKEMQEVPQVGVGISELGCEQP